ncbi:MAG: hypothetical protein GVY33_16495 [Alphaproteobacteria bacterium]|jgi:hypothetical protein|nr:hypothetical protein [Alphaproteobacteria bacterium]
MEGEGTLWMFILFKGLLGFGVPLALGLQQLISIKRSIRADREAAAAQAEREAAARASAAPGDDARTRVPEPA